jgi:hypothetical protein
MNKFHNFLARVAMLVVCVLVGNAFRTAFPKPDNNPRPSLEYLGTPGEPELWRSATRPQPMPRAVVRGLDSYRDATAQKNALPLPAVPSVGEGGE